LPPRLRQRWHSLYFESFQLSLRWLATSQQRYAELASHYAIAIADADYGHEALRHFRDIEAQSCHLAGHYQLFAYQLSLNCH